MGREEKFYTTKELTEMLNVSRYLIWRAVKSGDLVVTKKGGYKNVENLFSESAVRQFVENCMA